MNNEIELISDGEGVVVVGTSNAVERFVQSVGLAPSDSPSAAGDAFTVGSVLAKAGSEVSANSARWVKLTKESAKDLEKIGLTPTETRGVSHAMLGQRGSIEKWLQIETANRS